MATLDSKAIRETLPAAFRYNENPEKNLPPDGLTRVSAYIRGEHSVERLYSRGHNGCSSNPELAIEQFRACEALYRKRKAGARESGLGEGKRPILAEHLFLSFPPDEAVDYQKQCAIADELCASPLLRDFYAFSNRHWNTDNDHTHILVNNYSKDGRKKFCLNNRKRNALRKELDRICVKHGLSIIDNPSLRWQDPEREAFIRRVVSEGRSKVYAPADYQKVLNPERDYDRWMLKQIETGRVAVAEGTSRNRGGTQAQAYRRWIATQYDFVRSKNKRAAKYDEYGFLHEDDAHSNVARMYYWDPRYRKRIEDELYFCAVRIYDADGNRKPMIILLIELLLIAAGKEALLYDFKDMEGRNQEDKNERFFARTNRELQAMADAYDYRRKHGIQTPADLDSRIALTGTALAEARQGLAYYEKVVATAGGAFAEKKVEDLSARIKELKQDYHELKFIESRTEEFRRHADALLRSSSPSLDELLAAAKRQAEWEANAPDQLDVASKSK